MTQKWCWSQTTCEFKVPSPVVTSTLTHNQLQLNCYFFWILSHGCTAIKLSLLSGSVRLPPTSSGCRQFNVKRAIGELAVLCCSWNAEPPPPPTSAIDWSDCSGVGDESLLINCKSGKNYWIVQWPLQSGRPATAPSISHGQNRRVTFVVIGRTEPCNCTFHNNGYFAGSPQCVNWRFCVWWSKIRRSDAAFERSV